MSLQDRIRKLKDSSFPDQLQGVTKSRIRAVLEAIDRESNDIVDTVFALLDDLTPSLFSSARTGTKFCDGASTQHIASHVGTFQRKGTRLDREGRDYWIKPLRDLGAIEPVYLQPETGAFILGHPVAKSPNSAYRLANDFLDILIAPDDEWRKNLKSGFRKIKYESVLNFKHKWLNLQKTR